MKKLLMIPALTNGRGQGLSGALWVRQLFVPYGNPRIRTSWPRMVPESDPNSSGVSLRAT